MELRSKKSSQQITTGNRIPAVGPSPATTAAKSTTGIQAANKTTSTITNNVNCQPFAKTVTDKNRTITIRAPTLPYRFRVVHQRGAGSSQPAPRLLVPPLISLPPPPPPAHRTQRQVLRGQLSKSGAGSPANSNSTTSGAAGKKFSAAIANVTTNLTNPKRININTQKNTVMDPSTSGRQGQQQQPQHHMKTRSQNSKNNNGPSGGGQVKLNDGVEGMGNKSSGSDEGGQNESPLLQAVAKGLRDLGNDYELIDLTTPPDSPLPLGPHQSIQNNTSSATSSKDGQIILPPIPQDGSQPGQLPDAGASKVLAFDNEDIPLMWNMERCNCQFCGTDLMAQEGCMLNKCLHVFCRSCIKSSIELQGGLQAKCPLTDGGANQCSEFILQKEIIAVLTAEVYQQYVEQSMKNAKQGNIFECTTPNCKGWCEFEPGRKTFLCYLCTKQNCLECMASHEGMDCVAYKAMGKSAQEKTNATNNNQQNGWEQLQRLIFLRNWKLENVMEQLQDAEIFVTTMLFDCPICMSEVGVGRGIILQDCLHMFCRECLVEMVKHCDEPEVKCPYMDANLSCVNYLKPREIKALVPQDIYEQHLFRSVALAESAMVNSYHCKTPDCHGWCELEDGVENPRADIFECYVCKKRNCLKCNVIHHGLSCDDYKNRLVQDENEKLSEQALQKMVESGEAMKCKCGCVVQKLVGCDWLVCSKCRCELCWATKGPRWGPKGKGDITGGCKCDLRNGKPCVRTCQNCH